MKNRPADANTAASSILQFKIIFHIYVKSPLMDFKITVNQQIAFFDKKPIFYLNKFFLSLCGIEKSNPCMSEC